jgi:hypothetical protein
VVDFWIPEESSGEIVTLGELDAAPLRAGIARWRTLRGARPFPELSDAVVAAISANAFLVQVVDKGADYQFRSVGAALVSGFDEDFSGLRLSELSLRRPRFGIGLRMLYDMVRSSGEPMGYRGWVGKDMPGALFVYHENAILPFGLDEAQVDHLVVVTALVPRQGIFPMPPGR